MKNVINWKPVKDYYGFYEISDCGTVRGIKRTITLQGGHTRVVAGRILKPKINNYGYYFVTLSIGGVVRTKYLHRLVAEAFLENPDNLPEVNHLDGNKATNNVSNLAWCTHQQNVQHCFDTGLCRHKGAGHCFSVGVIDNYLGLQFDTIKDWCAARGINYNTGRNILNGSNTSKTIDVTNIFLQKKSKTNE